MDFMTSFKVPGTFDQSEQSSADHAADNLLSVHKRSFMI